MSFPSLGQRLLPAVEGGGFLLHASSPCPTMDVVLLTSAKESNLSLWRVGGQSGKIWDQNLKEPAEAFVWSPDGQYLSELHKDVLSLRSVHTGSEVNRTKLSNKGDQHEHKRRRISLYSWRELSSSTQAAPKKAHAQDLIDHLPTLPTNITNHSAQAQGTSTAKSRKQEAHTAMTEFAAPISTVNPVVEQKTSNLNVFTAYPHSFPSLPPTVASDTESLTINTLDSSLLISAEEHSGKLSLYLGGTLYLGELSIEKEATTLCTQILPSKADQTSLAVLYSTSHKLVHLKYATYTLPVPTEALRTIARAATTIRVLLDGIFERLEEGVRLWTEATNLGEKWVERLGNVLENHGAAQAVPRQLMRMLLTGRVTNGIKEYLASKITERSLSKWEQAIIAGAGYIRSASYQSIAPSLERIILWLEEIRGWAISGPNCLQGFTLDSDKVEEAIKQAQEALMTSVHLEQAAVNDERSFVEFAKWMKFEIDTISAKETSSEAKVQATHDPITISKFLQNELCLFDTNSLIAPPDSDIFRTRACKASAPSDPIPLEQVKELIRNKQPLPATKSSDKIEESLTTQIFDLTSRLGDFFNSSLAGILDDVEADGSVQVGMFENGQLDHKQIVMRATEDGQCYVCVHTGGRTASDLTPSLLWLCSIDRDLSYSLISYPTFTTETDKFSILSFDFFDDVELAILGQAQRKDKGPKSFIGTIKYTDVEWPQDTGDAKINANKPHQAGKLSFARYHALESSLAPQQLSLNGRRGRRIGCVLGNEHRQLEFLDMEEVEEDETEEGSDDERMEE